MKNKLKKSIYDMYVWCDTSSKQLPSDHCSVTIECKYGNRVPKTKIRRKPDSFELVYTKL